MRDMHGLWTNTTVTRNAREDLLQSERLKLGAGADLELRIIIDVIGILMIDMGVIFSSLHSNFPLSLHKLLLSGDSTANTLDPPLAWRMFLQEE